MLCPCWWQHPAPLNPSSSLRSHSYSKEKVHVCSTRWKVPQFHCFVIRAWDFDLVIEMHTCDTICVWPQCEQPLPNVQAPHLQSEGMEQIDACVLAHTDAHTYVHYVWCMSPQGNISSVLLQLTCTMAALAIHEYTVGCTCTELLLLHARHFVQSY